MGGCIRHPWFTQDAALSQGFPKENVEEVAGFGTRFSRPDSRMEEGHILDVTETPAPEPVLVTGYDWV